MKETSFETRLDATGLTDNKIELGHQGCPSAREGKAYCKRARHTRAARNAHAGVGVPVAGAARLRVYRRPDTQNGARGDRARARVHSRIVFDTAGCGAEFDELGRGSPEPPEVSDEPRTPSNIDVMGGGDDTEDRAVELSQVSAVVGSPDTSRGYGPGGMLDLSA